MEDEIPKQGGVTVDVIGGITAQKIPKLAIRLNLSPDTYFNIVTDQGDIDYWTEAAEGIVLKRSDGGIYRNPDGEPYLTFPYNTVKKIPAYLVFEDLKPGTADASLIALIKRQEAKEMEREQAAKDALKKHEVTVHERDAGFDPKAKGNAAAQMHLNSHDISVYAQEEIESNNKQIAELKQANEASKASQSWWEYLKSRMRSINIENMESQNVDSTSAPAAPASAEVESDHPHIDPNAYYRSYWEGPQKAGEMLEKGLAKTGEIAEETLSEPHVEGGLNGALGTAEAVGGLIMAGVGGMTAETIVGAGAAIAGTVIAANGYDKAAAGFRQMMSGAPQETAMQQAARDTSALFGADEEQQEKAAEAMGFAQDALPLLIGNPEALGVLGKTAKFAREGEAAANETRAAVKPLTYDADKAVHDAKAKAAELNKRGDGDTVLGEKRAVREGKGEKPIPKAAPANKVQYHGKTAQGNLEHYSGTEPPERTGMSPNSLYSHIVSSTGRIKQNAIYDSEGNVIGHVDFKNHRGSATSGHYHTFPPGHPEIGHDTGAPHYPYSTMPPGWDTLPPGVEPQTPIGK